jgi:hypothetical protein
LFGRLQPALAVVMDEFNGDGDERDKDDSQDDQGKVIPDKGQVAEIVTDEEEESDPDEATGDVESEEATVIHSPGPGDKGSKGPHDGHKTSQDDGFAAMLSEEGVGTL